MIKKVLLSATALLCISFAGAQVQIDNVDLTEQQLDRKEAQQRLRGDQEQKAPELFEGESEDLGPQYLLLRKPTHKYFTFFTDLQWFYTQNATLAEDQGGPTDVMAWTSELAYAPPAMDSFFGGKMTPRAGLRYQIFRYGQLKGDDQVILANGNQVDTNDFNAIVPFGELRWRKEDLAATLGFQYTELNSRASDETFYQEHALYWSFTRSHTMPKNALMQIRYDGKWRFTETEPIGTVPSDWNDRNEHALSWIFTKVIEQKWVIQPSMRLQYTDYDDNGGRDRTDVGISGNVNVAYYIDDNFSVRSFIGIDRRKSSENGNDYQNYNIGLGASAVFKF